MSRSKRSVAKSSPPRGTSAGREVEISRELVLRIAGSDAGTSLTPRRADPMQVLAIAAAYLESIQAMAADEDTRLAVRGLALRSGSVEFAFGVESVSHAQQLAHEVSQAIELPDAPPAIRRLRAALGRLPEGVAAEVRIGGWQRPLAPSGLVERKPPRELTTFRAEIVRVGGVHPAVRFRCGDLDFSLDANKDQLRRFGEHLYHEVEVDAEVERDEHGRIVGGRVLDVARVSEGDALGAWQHWFNENAGDWDEAGVEGFLGRNRD